MLVLFTELVVILPTAVLAWSCMDGLWEISTGIETGCTKLGRCVECGQNGGRRGGAVM